MEHFKMSAACNQTLEHYVYNLTSSYADQRNEGTMVATSIVMFALAALFFNLNLFSHLSDMSAILNPSVRLFLSTSLSLFLPVMSYLFSEAKNEGGGGGETAAELSLRARIILMWMILVELLCKKAEAILVSAGVQVYSGTIERAARIAWLGYLVFYNLRSAGKKALYGILWVLAAAKLVQRFVTMELAKRSFAYGKNPTLVTSYMAQVLLLKEEDSHGHGLCGSELLKRCNYVVTGEEDLEKKAGPSGYDLEPQGLMEAITNADSTSTTSVITVGKIWKLAETDELLRRDPRLKRLCLSMALYKLLRRRLEDFPITDAETRNCHDLIFKGLIREQQRQEEEEEAKCPDGEATATATTAGGGAVALFQVLGDEVQFLCEHYHSVHPVVLASPFFFLANYILFPIVVWALCILMVILCSNGDLRYAIHSFSADNYVVSLGIVRTTGCILSRVTRSPTDLFSTVDISITALLWLAFAYEQVWELLVFLLSNWFMVSLLSSYTSSKPPRLRRWLSRVIRSIIWVRNLLSQQPNNVVYVKQLSLLWCYRRHSSVLLPARAVPLDAKRAIMERLAKVSSGDHGDGGGGPHPGNVWQHYRQLLQLQPAEEEDDLGEVTTTGAAGVAKVILVWHVATALLEAKYPETTSSTKPGGEHERKVATVLSGYCAYLVAFQPELLPDDKDGTERVYKDMTEELKKEMGCLRYYASRSRQGARFSKLMEIAGQRREETATTSTLRKGAMLGKVLIEQAATDEDTRALVWKLLAELWTEVATYAAPTGSERHVKAHKEALAQGGEFITVLWALTTHTGITRGQVAPPPAACV